jgi:hypothetical protein
VHPIVVDDCADQPLRLEHGERPERLGGGEEERFLGPSLDVGAVYGRPIVRESEGRGV